MKNQTLYRGSDNKKEKLTKTEKVFNAVQLMRRKVLAIPVKKETTA